MIAALAEAGCVFARPGLARARRGAFDFVAARDERGRRPPLPCLARRRAASRRARRLRQSEPRRRWRCTRRPARRGISRGEQSWVAIADRHYCRCRAAAISSPPTMPKALIARSKNGATISPTRRATARSPRCWRGSIYLTGEEDYRAGGAAIARGFRRRGAAQHLRPRDLAQRRRAAAARAADRHRRRRDAADTQALLAARYRRDLPNGIVSVIAPGAALPPAHPAAGKGEIARPAPPPMSARDRCARCRWSTRPRSPRISRRG